MNDGERIVCPLCKQDWFVRAKIIRRDEAIRICPECDAIALGHDLQPEIFHMDFDTYMKSHGLVGLWTELLIEDLWRFPEQEEGKPFRVIR